MSNTSANELFNMFIFCVVNSSSRFANTEKEALINAPAPKMNILNVRPIKLLVYEAKQADKGPNGISEIPIPPQSIMRSIDSDLPLTQHFEMVHVKK